MAAVKFTVYYWKDKKRFTIQVNQLPPEVEVIDDGIQAEKNLDAGYFSTLGGKSIAEDQQQSGPYSRCFEFTGSLELSQNNLRTFANYFPADQSFKEYCRAVYDTVSCADRGTYHYLLSNKLEQDKFLDLLKVPEDKDINSFFNKNRKTISSFFVEVGTFNNDELFLAFQQLVLQYRSYQASIHGIKGVSKLTGADISCAITEDNNLLDFLTEQQVYHHTEELLKTKQGVVSKLLSWFELEIQRFEVVKEGKAKQDYLRSEIIVLFSEPTDEVTPKVAKLFHEKIRQCALFSEGEKSELQMGFNLIAYDALEAYGNSLSNDSVLYQATIYFYEDDQYFKVYLQAMKAGVELPILAKTLPVNKSYQEDLAIDGKPLGDYQLFQFNLPLNPSQLKQFLAFKHQDKAVSAIATMSELVAMPLSKHESNENKSALLKFLQLKHLEHDIENLTQTNQYSMHLHLMLFKWLNKEIQRLEVIQSQPRQLRKHPVFAEIQSDLSKKVQVLEGLKSYWPKFDALDRNEIKDRLEKDKLFKPAEVSRLLSIYDDIIRVSATQIPVESPVLGLTAAM